MNAVLEHPVNPTLRPSDSYTTTEREAEHRSEQPSTIFQTSTMSALLDGVFEGSMTMAELKQHGDFGIGTFNELDGELIAFDGDYYRLRSDSSVTPVKPEDGTPFASVTFFQPVKTFRVNQPMSRSELEQLIDSLLPSLNLFYAIRIDGEFERVVTRTVAKQKPPFRPFLEAIESQPTFTLEKKKGTVAAFRMPAFAQGIAVAGYHHHFVDDARTGGGHVLDLQLKSGIVQIGKPSEVHMHFPETEAFMNADLTSRDLDAEIAKAEG